jgi:penicillin-binding protein-related factor A (putative recombinase)
VRIRTGIARTVLSISVRRGGDLENAVQRASRAYRRDGRKLVLLRQESRTANIGGQLTLVGPAPVDHLGTLDGKCLAIESKTTRGKSLPVSRLRDDQVSLMGLLHAAGAEVSMVVYFSDLDEPYLVAWPEIATFLATRWRSSWPLCWFRVHGLLLPQEETSGGWLVRFLSGAPHPQRDAALAELERDKARPRTAREEEDEDPIVYPAAPVTAEERRLRVQAAAEEGVRRQMKRGAWGRR